MATSVTAAPAGLGRSRPAARPGPRLSPRRDLITMVFGSWLMVGLFTDGWAHNQLPQLETFFTPWHALFYSGFAATALWMLEQVRRNRKGSRRWQDAVPAGYGLGLLGVAVFLAGGAGDMAWHTVFGIEQGIEALYSPTHLLLFVGATLILSTPLRVGWADGSLPAAPGYRRLLPVVLSATALTALVSFMFMYWSAFVSPAPSWAGSGRPVGGLLLQAGLAAVMATSLTFLAPLLLLARRWRLPFGTATTLYGAVGTLMSGIEAFSHPQLIAAALAAGVLADALLAWIRPATSAPRRYWLAAAALPLATWSVYFATAAVTSGISWTLEVWTGAIVWTSLLGCGLGLLMLPPRPGAAP